jgi:phosphatidylserine decarboxylase
VGLIKFGSRTDVLLDVSANVQIKVGDRVKGGSSVLAYFHGDKNLVGMAEEQTLQGVL